MADVSQSTTTNRNDSVKNSSSSEIKDKVADISNSSNESRNPNIFKSKNNFPLRSSILGSSLLAKDKKCNESLTGKSISFVLNPPRLSNPFAKKDEDKEEELEINKGKSDEIRNQNIEEGALSKSQKLATENGVVTPTKALGLPSQASSDVGGAGSGVSFVPLRPSSSSLDEKKNLPQDKLEGGMMIRNKNESSSTVMKKDEEKSTIVTSSSAPSSSSSSSILIGGGGGGSSSLAPRPSNPGFIFGENLHERVEMGMRSERRGGENDETTIKTNGAETTGMLFTSSIVKKEENEMSSGASGGAGGGMIGTPKTLSEAAREYEESRAVKRKFEEVTIVTGEEEESNVLQMNCKLFAFDKVSSNWVERGRGTLRLNDLPQQQELGAASCLDDRKWNEDDEGANGGEKEEGKKEKRKLFSLKSKNRGGGGGLPQRSRLIVRAAGSFRLVLNTKLWSGMAVTRASPKSLTITAMDSFQVVKVFLIMASPKEIDQLEKALEWRLEGLREFGDGGGENHLERGGKTKRESSEDNEEKS